MWVAMAHQARGELAAARGDVDQALAHYAEAHAAYSAAGNTYEAARCLDTAAALRLKRGAADDLMMAQTTRAEARQIFERLGAA